MEKISGKIYGFIGPANGGKSYQLNQLQNLAIREERDFIQADFSDGIRQAILNIFGITECSVDLLSPCYSEWKEMRQRFTLPIGSSLTDGSVTGRELLKNVGEYIKTLAGEDVWARWTCNDICRQYWNLENDSKRKDCVIAFGSVRFEAEVNMVFAFAKLLNKELELRFCNYQNVNFDPNVHISESLGHQLILRGHKDGDDVTVSIREMFNSKSSCKRN